MKNKFKFSVIIPIYNTAIYIDDAVGSVVGQTLDFEKNIQIILVNDGSTDGSEQVCQKWVKLYPKNIKYIKQKNQGVSSARNNGMKYAEGEFINFLDSDDKWSSDAFEKGLKMLQNRKIDMVSVRVKFFEDDQSYHSLDYEFAKDQIVDVVQNYSYIQTRICSSFIRARAIEKMRFDEGLKYCEDIKFLAEIILNNSLVGIIASTEFFYRKRKMGTSAMQNVESSDWLLISPKKCFSCLCDLSRKKYGSIIPYIQFLIAFDYRYRSIMTLPKMSKKDLEEYRELSKMLLGKVGDDIIRQQPGINDATKWYMIEYKNKHFVDELNWKNEKLYYGDLEIDPGITLWIDNISVSKSGKMNIKGEIETLLPKEAIDFKPNICGRLSDMKIGENSKEGERLDGRNPRGKINLVLGGKLDSLEFVFLCKGQPLPVTTFFNSAIGIDPWNGKFVRTNGRLIYARGRSIINTAYSLRNYMYLLARKSKASLASKVKVLRDAISGR